MSLDDAAVRERVGQVERQLAELEQRAHPELRDALGATLASLLALYGEGLRRILRHTKQTGGDALHRALADDEWVGPLLILHGLHPDPTAERVARALDAVRPDLQAHGGDVELLGVTEGVVHLRLQGACDGCPASAQTLRDAIEAAVCSAAPEIERIDAGGRSGAGGGRVLNDGAGDATPAWGRVVGSG